VIRESPPQGITPKVDAHAHIFTLAMPFVARPRHRPTYSFTSEQYLEILDRHGVEYGVIAAASPWGDYNDYTRASVRAHPRLRGTVILHPEKRYDLEAMDSEGIVGVRLPFIGLSELPDLRSRKYQHLFRTLADLGWHVHLHVEGERMGSLLGPIEDSGVRLVIDHLGRPERDDGVGSAVFGALVAAVQRGRTWVKVSCRYRIGPAAEVFLRGLLDSVPSTRLFWASDCPFVGHESEVQYGETIDWVAGIVQDEETRRLVFGENAYGFYFD